MKESIECRQLLYLGTYGWRCFESVHSVREKGKDASSPNPMPMSINPNRQQKDEEDNSSEDANKDQYIYRRSTQGTEQKKCTRNNEPITGGMMEAKAKASQTTRGKGLRSGKENRQNKDRQTQPRKQGGSKNSEAGENLPQEAKRGKRRPMDTVVEAIYPEVTCTGRSRPAARSCQRSANQQRSWGNAYALTRWNHVAQPSSDDRQSTCTNGLESKEAY